MTIPMLPIGGQISSLLRSAKRQAGLLEDEEDPTVGAPPAALPFGQMPQQMQAPQMQGGQMPASDAHAHKEGLLGRLGHAFGGDRIQPEVAALLTPDQQSRIRRGAGGALWDYLARGETTSEAQQRRAGEMLTLGDTKQAREAAARTARIEQQIQAVAGSMPPQEGAEYAARMRLMYGLPNAAPMAQAADQMRAKDPMQVSRGAAVRRPDGTWEIPSPIPEEPPPAPKVSVRTNINRGGQPFTVAVEEATGRVMWELPEVPPSPGAGRPPTETESKDYLYASMMENAMPDIRATVDNIRPEVITALRVDPTGATSVARTDEERVFVRAVLEFAAAANRKESGAAITPFEVSNTLDRYIDTGFDGPAGSPVRKAKAKARENYLSALRRTSGRARSFYENLLAGAPTGKTITQTEFNQLSPAAQQAARAGGYTITP